MSKLLTHLPEIRLTLDEEKELVESGDLMTLIEHNLREAFCYGKGTFQGRSLSDGNILSAAYEGLFAASKNFDPSRGLRFFAYAKPYIRGSLCKIHRLDDSLGFPGEPKRGHVHSHEPSKETIREEVQADEEEEEITYVPVRSDQLPPGTTNPDYDIIFVREEWAQLKPVLEKVLDARERMIIELNYLGGLNLREIADLVGVSRSDIHHGKQVALKKIRNYLIDTRKFSRE